MICALTIFWLGSNFCFAQNTNPILGSPYNYSKVRSGIPGTFYEKINNSTWNLSFIRPDYLVALKYQAVLQNERYRGNIIQADVKLVLPDGEKLYFSNRGGLFLLTHAVVSSEVTKSGFMLVHYDQGKPYNISDKSSGIKYSAKAKIDKSDLNANLARLFPTVDALTFKVDYSVNKVNSDSGILEINSSKLKVQKYTASIVATPSVETILRGQSKDVELRINSWPNFFITDISWGTFDVVNFYTNAFIDPVVSYKSKGNSVREIRCQISSSESPSFEQEEKAVVAYPNPSSGIVYIDLINHPKDVYRVEIYNLVGFKVKTFQFNDNDNRLNVDLSNLRPSIYMYSVFDSSGRRIASKRINLISS